MLWTKNSPPPPILGISSTVYSIPQWKHLTIYAGQAFIRRGEDQTCVIYLYFAGKIMTLVAVIMSLGLLFSIVLGFR